MITIVYALPDTIQTVQVCDKLNFPLLKWQGIFSNITNLNCLDSSKDNIFWYV